MTDIRDPIEERLYNRMRRNAFMGFLKSGGIAALMGAAVGAILIAADIIPAAALPQSAMAIARSVPAIAGALMGAVTLAIPAAAFGATSAIQATRDTRVYIGANTAAGHSILPEEHDRVRKIIEPLVEQEQPVRRVSYREALSTEPGSSQSTHRI